MDTRPMEHSPFRPHGCVCHVQVGPEPASGLQPIYNARCPADMYSHLPWLIVHMVLSCARSLIMFLASNHEDTPMYDAGQ
jgi:hypothetical protein